MNTPRIARPSSVERDFRASLVPSGTTGFNMPPERIDLWSELARIERIRFSIHSARPATYNAITGLPARFRALHRVRDNISRLLEQRSKYFRPTVSPFGILAPCDLTAEPRFADSGLNLGNVGHSSITHLVTALASHHVPDACAQCMPSSRTGNAVHHKLLADLRVGIALADQPFMFDWPADGDA